MKMATKAKTKTQRRVAKRGRPCKPNVARNDNGRIYEPKEPQEAPDVLARRKRVELFGGSMEDAGSQDRGTVIGRLWLTKDISDEQYSALERFGKLAARYQTVMCVPDSLKKTNGGSVMTIPDDDAEIEVRGKWREVSRAVIDANTYHAGNLMGALQYMVIRDEFHEHMVGDTRIAANALVRYYKLS